jgi:hypothetical protein
MVLMKYVVWARFLIGLSMVWTSMWFEHGFDWYEQGFWLVWARFDHGSSFGWKKNLVWAWFEQGFWLVWARLEHGLNVVCGLSMIFDWFEHGFWLVWARFEHGSSFGWKKNVVWVGYCMVSIKYVVWAWFSIGLSTVWT